MSVPAKLPRFVLWMLLASLLSAASAQARDLYWTDNDKRILASDIDGGNVTVIFDGNSSSPPMDGNAVDVVATASHIYWSDNPPGTETGGGIWRANRDGSGAQLFMPAPGGTSNLQFLAVNETDGKIYFSDYANGLYEANLADGSGLKNFYPGAPGSFTGLVLDPARTFGVDELLVLSAGTNWLYRAIPDWTSVSSERQLEGGNATYGIAYEPTTRTVFYTNHSEATLRSYSYLTQEHQLHWTPGMAQPLGIQLSPAGTHLLIAERGKGITAYQLSNGGYELLVADPTAHFGVAVTADPGDLPDPPPPPPPPGPGDLIFVADFEGDEIGGFPRTIGTGGVWHTATGPDNGVAEVVQDVDNIFGFGEENKFFRVRNANNVQMRGRFEPTLVASLSFDLIGRYEDGDGNRWLNMELQAGGGRTMTASMRFSNATLRTAAASDDSWPTPQGYTGPLNPSYGGNDIPLRLNAIANNSNEPITYTGPDGEEYLLSSGYSTIWIYNYNTGFWSHVLPEFDFSREGAVGAEMDSMRFLVDSNAIVRSFDIDNIHVRLGAVIDGPPWQELTYPEEPVLVVHDDFNHTPPTAPGVDRVAPGDYNGPLVLAYHSSAAGQVRIVQDVENLFGRGTDNQVLYLEEANGIRLNAYDHFLTGVVTFAFDMVHPGVFSELGVDRLTANFWSGGPAVDTVVSFGLEQRNAARGTYSVVGIEHQEIAAGHVQRYAMIINNMNDEITYDSPRGPQTLGAGETVIWLNGYPFAEPYSQGRNASTGTPIDSFQLSTLSSGYWQGYLDNIRIWEGAIIPDPDVPGRAVEPPSQPLIAYEGFNYSPGGLEGLAGGSGWDGGFLAAVLHGDAAVVSPGLDFAGLPSTGNRLLASNGARNLRSLATGQIHSSFLNPYVDHLGAPDTTIWLSFLGRGVPVAADQPQSVLIDLNDAVVAGGNWNTVGSTTASEVPLINSAGGSSGWTASLAGWRTSSITGNVGAFEGSDLADGIADYFFVQNAETGTITLSGLDPSKTYLVEVVSSRATGSATNRGGDFTVGGHFADSDPNGMDYHSKWDGHDTGLPLVWEAAVPDAQGELVISLTAGLRPGTTVFAYLNAVRVTEGTQPSWGLSLYRDSFEHGDRVLFVGKGAGEETAPFGEAPGGWKLEGGRGSTLQRAFSGVPYDELSLFVLRIDYPEGGDPVARLFHNPALGGAAPADGDAVAVVTTSLGSLGFDRIRIDGVGHGFEFDELRIGTSWEAVTSGEGEPPAGGYSAWLDEHFDAAEQGDTSISGPWADPDGDGLKNLVEYALGLDPRQPSREGLPVSGIAAFEVDGITSDYLTLTFTRPDSVEDVGYEVRTSSDLGSWAADAVLVDSVANGDGTTTYLYRDSEPLDSAARRFLRLEVTILD